MVANARLNGHSWDEIARAIGTSSEEARLRVAVSMNDRETPLVVATNGTLMARRP
jgi:hypothetical protein